MIKLFEENNPGIGVYIFRWYQLVPFLSQPQFSNIVQYWGVFPIFNSTTGINFYSFCFLAQARIILLLSEISLDDILSQLRKPQYHLMIYWIDLFYLNWILIETVNLMLLDAVQTFIFNVFINKEIFNCKWIVYFMGNLNWIQVTPAQGATWIKIAIVYYKQ